MTWVRLALMAVLYGAGSLVVAWFAAGLALAGTPTEVALGVRTALVGAVLVLVTRRGMRDVRLRGGRDVLVVGVAGLVGLALDPFAWVGRAFAGQLVADAGAVTVAVDAVLWVAVVTATAAAVVGRSTERREVGYAS